MIPTHLSLVPVSPFQLAAIQAIASVEAKQDAGRSLPTYPYAKALFRSLNEGRGKITAMDIWSIDTSYNPRERQGSTKQRYIEALDVLISSRGERCPMPLPDSLVRTFFPETRLRHQERRYRRADLQADRQQRQQEKARLQKRRRYQTQVAQAEIELAFTTPSELAAWYKRQERQGIYDDELIGMVQAWGQRFTRLHRDAFYLGSPLWAIVKEMRGELESRSVIDQWLDALMLPNKLAATS
ncbi:plasmid SOS inhibition protein A [Serratia fonticola]